MSQPRHVSSFLERVVARFLSIIVALGLARQRTPSQLRKSNTDTESNKDVLLALINGRKDLRDRVALSQSREIVKGLFKQGEELRKKMKDTLAHIKISSLQASKEDCERIVRDGEYPAGTDENLQMKRQMVLNLNTLGYGCRVTDSWKVLYTHQITLTED